MSGSSIFNSDSGGGLVFERIENQEATYYIRGLVSLGVQSEGTCDSYKYSTYTKISSHMTFIRESITLSQTSIMWELFSRLFLNICLLDMLYFRKTELNSKPS